MATLISVADGSLNGAAVFATTVTSTGALNLIRFNQTTTHPAAGTTTSVAFTVTAGAIVDGVLLWVRQNTVNPTGTLKVGLNKGGVEQASVTVDKIDLPPPAGVENHPVFFKFTGTATGDGAANWTIVLITTGTGLVNVCSTISGVTNLTRALRTTTLVTAAAADDIYIVGELTGQGTRNVRAINMLSTTAVVYGSGVVNSTTVSGGTFAISHWASLTYGTTPGVNYVLRLAADLRVHHGGTLTIGAVGAEFPRTGTAVLEFQPVSDASHGLAVYDGGVCTLVGLSRTAGKNIDRCKLTANVTAQANVLLTGTITNGTVVTGLEPTGNSMIASAYVDNTTSGAHGFYTPGASVNNVIQTATVCLARGSGLNNRYVRLTVGNLTTVLTTAHGFYVDVDLQLGTIGTVTPIGNGVAISASITPMNNGYMIKMTGKVNAAAAATPYFHINSCAVAGVLSYVGNTTSCYLYDRVYLTSATSIPISTFDVDTDTGWLANDSFAVAATGFLGAESDIYQLDVNAGASSLTSALAISYNHSGTVPTQAEIILINRNVKVRSTSTSFSTFVFLAGTATFTASWAEFHRLGGPGTTIKQGILVTPAAVASPKNITYCCMHDFTSYGVYCDGALASLNLNVSNNVFWATESTFTVAGAVSSGDWVFNNNIIMRPGNDGISLSDGGGVCTNNIVCSMLDSDGIRILVAGLITGSIDNNTVHSGGGYGFTIIYNTVGTINNLTVWRVDDPGIYITGNVDVVFNNLVLFGNDTVHNLYIASYVSVVTVMGNSIIAGDATRVTANGIAMLQGGNILKLQGVDMSGSTSPYPVAPHTNDFHFAAAPFIGEVYASNCKFGGTNLISTTSKALWGDDGYVSFQKFNQTPGDHRTEMKYGSIKTDQAIFKTAAPSLRLSPISAADKLESAPATLGVLVPVASGSAINISVYVRKSEAADGALYSGSQPRLIQRANPALGQNSDVVLATGAGGSAVWTMLSATSSTANDDGVWEFIIDCDGIAGWINVDDWEFTNAAVTANGMMNWFNGHPVVGGSGGGGGGGSREFFSVSLS